MRFFLIAAAIYCSVLPLRIFAQKNNLIPVNFDSSSPQGYATGHITAFTESGKKVRLNEINIKALTHLRKTFKGADNETWRVHSDGEYVASFMKDDISYIVYYDKKGRWLATVKGYNEDKMSFDLRDLVKRNYYDYSISYVKEVKTYRNDTITFVVSIQYKNLSKVIRIQNGEMDILQELKNG